MKKLALIIAATAFIAGCSTTKAPESVKDERPIADQQLVSNFKRNNIKVEWSCKWFTGITETTCVRGGIKAIEATGYATSFGNTEANRETAFQVAEDTAKANLSRFVKDDVTTSRVTNTFTKNIEKATDEYKRKGVADEVSVSDTDKALTTDNNRVNSNETVRTVTNIITSRSQMIIQGAQVTSQEIVDKQTVAVTIRWSVENADAVKGISKYFR